MVPRILTLLLLAGCRGEPAPGGAPGDDTAPTGDDGGEETGDTDEPDPPRWAGEARVQVVDPDGAPVPEALVMLGGWSADRWQVTDAEGRATLQVDDDGITDRALLAGRAGWVSSGVDIRETEAPDDPVVIRIKPLPAADNPAYAWQAGGSGSSPDTTECGHCHPTIADDWAGSAHHEAARNPRTWDLYTGGAREVDAATCAELGGWLVEGATPGAPDTVETRCATGAGVLPLLNAGCGGPGEAACDHPDQAPTAFGACADCHAPAQDGALGGRVDLVAATGLGHTEGVTCDLCHKVEDVDDPAAPGLDGSLVVLRPSEDTNVVGQEFDPITFGPYPDVILPIMKGAYAPVYREADYCAGCHEYARGALAPDRPVDAARWPGGLPVHETWSEWAAGPYGGTGATCQYCHMAELDEESSTYDITPTGLPPSIDQGWLRETGEVRHHDFRADIGAPALALSLRTEGEEVVAEVSVTNVGAGHAVPTGEPLRQLLVRVEATADGNPVPATGGRAIPDVGGYRAQGTVGADLAVDGRTLAFPALRPGAVAPTAVRFARPVGWDDYAGPGTGPWAALSAEAKGLPDTRVLGEVAVATLDGTTVTLVADPPDLAPGDVAWLVGGHQAAGAPGWLYAKVLVDPEGARGVAHYRAVDIASDNRLAPGDRATTEHRFPLREGLTVTATLVARGAAAPVADAHGWDVDDETLAQDSATP